MEQDNFWTRYFAALDAGLNHEFCIKAAYKEISLDDALGEMDMDAESDFGPNFNMCDDNEEIDDDDYIPW